MGTRKTPDTPAAAKPAAKYDTHPDDAKATAKGEEPARNRFGRPVPGA